MVQSAARIGIAILLLGLSATGVQAAPRKLHKGAVVPKRAHAPEPVVEEKKAAVEGTAPAAKEPVPAPVDQPVPVAAPTVPAVAVVAPVEPERSARPQWLNKTLIRKWWFWTAVGVVVVGAGVGIGVGIARYGNHGFPDVGPGSSSAALVQF